MIRDHQKFKLLLKMKLLYYKDQGIFSSLILTIASLNKSGFKEEKNFNYLKTINQGIFVEVNTKNRAKKLHHLLTNISYEKLEFLQKGSVFILSSSMEFGYLSEQGVSYLYIDTESQTNNNSSFNSSVYSQFNCKARRFQRFSADQLITHRNNYSRYLK
jgi:hypothetical protein